jgi:hypothetical protein
VAFYLCAGVALSTGANAECYPGLGDCAAETKAPEQPAAVPTLIESVARSQWAVGTSANCGVPRKLYSLTVDGSTITWHDGEGNADVEEIVSSGAAGFSTKTLKSIHSDSHGEPQGAKWAYSRIDADSVRVMPSGKNEFVLVRCQ